VLLPVVLRRPEERREKEKRKVERGAQINNRDLKKERNLQILI